MIGSIMLSDIWLAKAIAIGEARYLYAVEHALRMYGNIDYSDQGDSLHIAGAISEAVVAKHFKLPWKPHIGVIDGIDVGGLIEVRARRVPGTGTDLAIRPDDKDDLPYVHSLVYADNSVTLKGWLYGRDGKGRGVWNSAKCVWFNAPPYRPISELEKIINDTR
jgi:hypothetical protein